jgi:outer membrane biosynthesis protein TonB
MAKETTKKTAALKSASAIVEDVKETAKESKVAKEVKEVKEKVKETATKVKETASKVKETASKTVKKAKEASFVEFDGKQLSVAEITENAKKHWLASNKGDIADIKVYINTNQSKAFYVINNEDRGEFDI